MECQESYTAFGPGLAWDRMAGSRACKIICTLDAGSWADEDRWLEIQQETISAMERMTERYDRGSVL